MGRLLTISLFYLVLMASLAIHIFVLPPLRYDVFSEGLVAEARGRLDDNRNMLPYFHVFSYKCRVSTDWDPNYVRAVKIHRSAEAVFHMLEKHKAELRSILARRHPANGCQGFAIVKEYFVTQKKQELIRQELNAFLDYLLANISGKQMGTGYERLLMDRNYWNAALFQHVSLPGAIAVLSAMQDNVSICDYAALSVLQMRAHIWEGMYCEVPFEAVAFPALNHVLPGDEVNTTIFLVYYYAGIKKLAVSSGGKTVGFPDDRAVWTVIADRPGWNTITGQARFRIGDSAFTKPWSFRYFVVKNNVVSISFDKTTQCYRGIPTIITVSGGDYAPEHIFLRIPGASVKTLGPGRFEVIASNSARPLLTAYADATDTSGRKQRLAVLQIKVKDPPPPSLQLDGADENGISVNDLKASAGLVAVPVLEGVSYKILNWQLLVIRKAQADEEQPIRITGAALPEDAVHDLQPGDRLLASDVSVQDAYGSVYTLPPVSVRVK